MSLIYYSKKIINSGVDQKTSGEVAEIQKMIKKSLKMKLFFFGKNFLDFT